MYQLGISLLMALATFELHISPLSKLLEFGFVITCLCLLSKFTVNLYGKVKIPANG